MLVETLDRALQDTMYLHHVETLRAPRTIMEDCLAKVFNAQSYDILLAIYEVDLGEATRDEEDDRKVALIIAAIAAVLAARLSRDVAIVRPGILAALTAAVVNGGLAKYAIPGDLRLIDAEKYLLTHGAELVTQINETTRQTIARILTDSVKSGLSVDDIASRIMANVDDMKWWRARKIAITETSKAWTFAELESAGLMEGAGYKMVKEWLLGPLHPRYDPCDHNHEQGAIPIHQPFSTGDLGPPQHPNCGCSLITYPASDAEQPWGRPVGGQTPFPPPFGYDPRRDENA